MLFAAFLISACQLLKAQTPTISSFAPESGPVGSSVTITGMGFNIIASQNIVFFGATKATVTAATATSLTVTVPAGATYQNLSVTNFATNLTAYSAKTFVVTLDGNIAFADKVSFNTDYGTTKVRISDIDGDGKPDIATANFNGNSVSVLRNTSSPGAVTFATAIDFAAGTNPISVSIGDINGDGKPDLVSGNDGSNTLSVFQNTSAPAAISFAAKVDLATGANPSSGIGDIDGDGFPDLIAANWVGNSISVLRQLATPITLGTYANTTVIAGQNAVVTPTAAPSGPSHLTVSINTNFTGVLTFNPMTGVVRVTDAKQAGTYLVTIKAVNIGGTTTKSFTLTVSNPQARCQNLFGNTNVAAGFSYPGTVAIGDFNEDGKQDIAVANTGPGGKVSIRLGDGLGGFSGTTNVAAGPTPFDIATGDFNKDGHQDIAVANSGAVAIRLGDGLGGFSAGTDATGLPFPWSIAIGDFNGDGKQDFATGNSDATVSIRLGNGLGGFTSMPNVPVGIYPNSIAIGDFNGDGKQDFATANTSANTVSIRLGNGAGGFTGTTNLSVGSSPYSIKIGDFNGDGKQDLAVTNYISSWTTSILLGNGSGAFSGTTNVAVGANPGSLAIGDFNADGRQDFVTANYGSDNISVCLAKENEINLQGNGISIAAGDASPDVADGTDFGSTTGAPITRSFTIQNTGNADLSLGAGAITVSGTDAGLFAVNNVTLPATIPGPSGTLSFDVTYTLTGDATGNALTPVAGTYSLTATGGSNFTVTPTKNSNKLNGITVADVTAIQQHVTFINPITDPYKQVAADVNKSNSITTLDATIINQALLGNPAALAEIIAPGGGAVPLTTDNFGLYNISKGEIRVVWSQAAGLSLEEAASVFQLKFEVLQSGGKLSEALSLDQETLPGHAYNSALAESDVALYFLESTGTSVPVAATGLKLFQNQPNPFSAETTIGFELPASTAAQLRVFDAVGRELWRSDKNYTAGYHAEVVRLDQLRASGLLYYELTTPHGTLTKRMMLVD